jgi:hypothetical protein
VCQVFGDLLSTLKAAQRATAVHAAINYLAECPLEASYLYSVDESRILSLCNAVFSLNLHHTDSATRPPACTALSDPDCSAAAFLLVTVMQMSSSACSSLLAYCSVLMRAEASQTPTGQHAKFCRITHLPYLLAGVLDAVNAHFCALPPAALMECALREHSPHRPQLSPLCTPKHSTVHSSLHSSVCSSVHAPVHATVRATVQSPVHPPHATPSTLTAHSILPGADFEACFLMLAPPPMPHACMPCAAASPQPRCDGSVGVAVARGLACSLLRHRKHLAQSPQLARAALKERLLACLMQAREHAGTGVETTLHVWDPCVLWRDSGSLRRQWLAAPVATSGLRVPRR